MGYKVYFNGIESGNDFKMAVVIFDGFERMPEIVKERPKFSSNFLDPQMLALKLAVEVVLEEGFDEVTLINQNKQIFDWIQKEEHESQVRDTVYKQIREMLYEFVNEVEGANLSIEVVKGTKNEAKKYQDKYIKQGKTSMDITSLFKKNKVINFNKEAR